MRVHRLAVEGREEGAATLQLQLMIVLSHEQSFEDCEEPHVFNRLWRSSRQIRRQ